MGRKWTEQERENHRQQRQERNAERLALCDALPGCQVKFPTVGDDPTATVFVMEPGKSYLFIDYAKGGTQMICLQDNLPGIVELIEALISVYNVEVKRLNSHASDLPKLIESMTEIPEGRAEE